MTLQYIIIGILTLVALLFLSKKFQSFFKGDCSDGRCGCSQKMKDDNQF